MFSLIAIPMLVLVIVCGVALAIKGRTGDGRQRGWFANAPPALTVLMAMLTAYLAGWLIALAMAHS